MIEGALTCIGLLAIVCGMLFLTIVHEVKEGYIGIYSRGGAIMPEVSEPGWYFIMPVITKLHQIQIQIQTDKVTDIPCGTKNGVNLNFAKIEVVNQLKQELALDTIKNYTINYDKTWIFDKIHHEVNQFCSRHTLEEIYITKFSKLDEYLGNALQESCNQWAPGIKIISVRVTKPTVPSSTYQNYLQREIEKITIFTEQARQQYITKKSEIEKMVHTTQANTENAISKIKMDHELEKKKIEQQIEQLNDQIQYEKINTTTVAKKISQLKKINLQSYQYSNMQYILDVAITQLKKVKKFSYGQSIAEYIEESSKIFDTIISLAQNKNISQDNIKETFKQVFEQNTKDKINKFSEQQVPEQTEEDINTQTKTKKKKYDNPKTEL